jgi:hypothetical protein
MATTREDDTDKPKKKSLADRWREDEMFSNPSIQPPPKKKK